MPSLNEPEAEPENDFSLLDYFFESFFETKSEDMLPVLCGYFKKIVQALIQQDKDKMLEYLLLKKSGSLFDRMAANIDNHSVAILCYELLQIKVKPEPSYSNKKSENLFKTLMTN
jgi:hypothetical protein